MFREIFTERSNTNMKEYKGVDRNQNADKIITNDKYYDKIYVHNKESYDEAERKMVQLVANVYVWKVDYDPENYTISVRYEK